MTATLVDTPEGGDGALAWLAIGIAKGLNQPRVAVTAAGGDLDEHAPEYIARRKWLKLHYSQTLALQRNRKTGSSACASG
ncbi:hypothetical protein [Oryzisolibacter sp. LB2S]|uniref:hypothetical protein n=1 Tax=Alicycliphilus soli TaxID=3228789 RepID=UPI003457D5CE